MARSFGLDERLLHDLAKASRTRCWLFTDVIRYGRISARDAIQNPIEWNLRLRIAVLAGFNQFLGLAQSWGVNEDNVLLFRCWIEEVTGHRRGFYHPMLIIDSDCRGYSHFSGLPT